MGDFPTLWKRILNYINQDRSVSTGRERYRRDKTVQRHTQTYMESFYMTEKAFSPQEIGKDEQNGPNS